MSNGYVKFINGGSQIYNLSLRSLRHRFRVAEHKMRFRNVLTFLSRIEQFALWSATGQCYTKSN
jgi:hypothetical protein